MRGIDEERCDAEDHAEVEFSGVSPGPGLGMDEDLSTEIIETTATPDVLKLWPWVNQVRVSGFVRVRIEVLIYEQTPLTVSPQLPLEIAMQLFKRMG